MKNYKITIKNTIGYNINTYTAHIKITTKIKQSLACKPEISTFVSSYSQDKVPKIY